MRNFETEELNEEKISRLMFQPMHDYIPKKFWRNLMFMDMQNDIYMYKHYFTRNYINVDIKGNFYIYRKDTYLKIDKNLAIQKLEKIKENENILEFERES
ncbi:hypothetical protein [Clostridium sporogenes]|uniref:hypothetical protein n=1 Tax=Clostridium sporogenes TaxID=1509 RepID=UPI00066592BB|nr:hypothetical protein [Clostridium sporogenes]